jgi:Ni/Co efflux regulator RcnB
MKRHVLTLALGALSLMPVSLAQPAAAHDYYGYERQDRLERDIDRDRAAIHHDYAERRYYSEREREAARNGNYYAADKFAQLRRREEREIDSRKDDLHHDYRHYDRF